MNSRGRAGVTFIMVMGVLALTAVPVVAESLLETASEVVARASAEHGPYLVIQLVIPDALDGKRLDVVLLDLVLDLEPAATTANDYTTVIAAYPLLQSVASDADPVYRKDVPSARPLAVRSGQRIVLDITDIVRRWIASPQSNHGLVVGTFAGPRVATLGLTGGTEPAITFHYQNRSGSRTES